jgi:polygalacturonase
MVSLVKCKTILIDGPVFQNSPAWCLHPLMCENLIIRNITVKNPWFSQNGDGIDIESSKNCLLYDSNFDVGDDAICLKSGKDKEGRKRGMPTENLIIRNCIVYHGHGGVTIGSEMSGGIRNVYVSGCTFLGTDVGLRFKSNRGRGGIVENIFFTDIKMINIPTEAISFNLYYGGAAVSENPEEKNNNLKSEVIPTVSEETPLFRNITIKNIICKGARQAMFLQGLPEQNLENIRLENIDIEADNGITLIDDNGIIINNLHLITKASEVISLYNSCNIDIQKIDINENPAHYFHIRGNKSSKITIRSEKLKKAVISHEVDSSTVKIL